MSEKVKAEPQMIEIAGMTGKIKAGNLIDIPKSEYHKFREAQGETKEHREIEDAADLAFYKAVLPVLEEKVTATHEKWSVKGGAGDRSMIVSVAGETTGFNPLTKEPVVKYGRTNIQQHRDNPKVIAPDIAAMQARIEKSYAAK